MQLLLEPCIYVHSIRIDVTRTFPEHAIFQPRGGAGQVSLFNVLRAYSSLDDEVGYCQGMSFIAGLLLMQVRPVRRVGREVAGETLPTRTQVSEGQGG